MSLYLITNIVIFLVNILLFINAKKVVTYLNHGEENKRKTMIFKIFNVLLLLTHGADIVFKEYASDIINIGYTVISIYISFILYEVMSYFNRVKVGTKKEDKDKITVNLTKKEIKESNLSQIKSASKKLIIKTEEDIAERNISNDILETIINLKELLGKNDVKREEIEKRISLLQVQRSELYLKEEIVVIEEKTTRIKDIVVVKYENNFNTRINNIFILVFITSITIITFLKIWSMESALEQKGLIGIILAALLFTSAHWLPNIFKGLTLMNSNRMSRYDIVRMNHKFYIINEIGLQYTELRDIKSNKSVLLENSLFSGNKIANLSRKVSLDGYRDSIQFNVAYPSIDIKNEKEYDKNMEKWKSIFTEIYDKLPELKDIKVNSKYELFMIDTGDNAIKWEFSFYYEDFGKLNTTGAIRRVLSSRYRLIEMIQKKAHLRGISLSTPTLEQQVEQDD